MFIGLKISFCKNFKHKEKVRVCYNELPYAIHIVLSTVNIVSHFLFLSLSLFFFFGHTHGMWKFPGQGSNPQHGSDPNHRYEILNLLHHQRIPFFSLEDVYTYISLSFCSFASKLKRLLPFTLNILACVN